MCGLCGLVAIEGDLPPEADLRVRAMAGALAHRGPDGDGFFDDASAALGHRRLAIIDREGGSQPMTNEDGTCWIVFNGEVYNHRDLRPVLEGHGHRFRTHSDTEVILHAWEEYGTDCVAHLEGMFAFAIWDQRRRELFIARDRLGKKPLFYTVTGGVLQFASELNALRHSPWWDGEIDPGALESYLSLGYVLAPATFHRHVRKLPPAHWLHLSNGCIETKRYWDVESFDEKGKDDDWLDRCEALLRAAVHERLESEVPLGAFLSGGIDSGLVVSFMAEALGDRLVTTSVGFAEAAHNELQAARLTADHTHARHYEHEIAPKLDEVLEAVTTGCGEPLADSSTIPTWYVSKAAREHVTVALSGDGGDETFAGYDFRYVPHVIEGTARQLIPGPGRRMAGWLGRQWPRSPRLPYPLRVGSLLENLARDPASAYYIDLCFLKPVQTRRLMGIAPGDPLSGPVYEAVTAPYRRCGSRHPLVKAQYADLHVYLPNDPLVKVDRMSMAHSLEVRSPLLDRRVVEFAFTLPVALKQSGRTGKLLLRQLAKRRLPPALATMPKRGFTAPVREWIAGPYAGRYREEVLSAGAAVASLLDQRHLRQVFDANHRGERDHSYILWAVWALERWLQDTRSGSQMLDDAGTLVGKPR
jgi:asparagine synthase (glutamine-hydrolysing)